MESHLKKKTHGSSHHQPGSVTYHPPGHPPGPFAPVVLHRAATAMISLMAERHICSNSGIWRENVLEGDEVTKKNVGFKSYGEWHVTGWIGFKKNGGLIGFNMV